MSEMYRALVRPVITEKTTAKWTAVTPQGRELKEYVFRAQPHATKPEIRAAIESLFGVNVVHIRTLVQRAKRKTRGRTQGIRPRWKKAYVRLKEGQTIEGIFEG